MNQILTASTQAPKFQTPAGQLRAEAPFPCQEPKCDARFRTMQEQDAHMADAHGLVWLG